MSREAEPPILDDMTAVDAPQPAEAGTDEPPLFWTLADHTDQPSSALFESMWIEPFNRGFAEGFARYGVLAAGIRGQIIDGWLYMAFVPLTEPAAFGERIGYLQSTDVLADLRAAAEAALGRLPEYEARRRSLGANLESLTDEELSLRVGQIADAAGEFVVERFAGVPISALGGEFGLAAEEAGLDPEAAFNELGPVAASVAMAASLGGVAAAIERESPALAERLRSGRPVAFEELAAIGDVDRRLDEDRDLLLATSLSVPTLGERPELVVDLLRRYLARRPTVDGSGPGMLPESMASRAEGARLAHRWRDETGRAIVLWLGLVRRAALEAGRRLSVMGTLAEADDVLHLTVDELSSALVSGEDQRPLAGERANAFANAPKTPPAAVGTPPSGPPPGADQLPPAAQRHMRRVQWYTARLGPDPRPTTGDPSELVGVGAAPGTQEGRARIVDGPDDFASIDDGDIIVCSTTSPMWNAVLALASAVVCETGGFVSHAALIARELGIPAVVGVAGARGRIADGSMVRVDGSAGRVDLIG